jgi:hypothetical protein
MFKTVLFATAIVAAQAWERSYNDRIQPEAYGSDNQHYGHQGSDYGYGLSNGSGYGRGYGLGNRYGHGAGRGGFGRGGRGFGGFGRGGRGAGSGFGARNFTGQNFNGRAGIGAAGIAGGAVGGAAGTAGFGVGGFGAAGRALGGGQGQQQWNVADAHNSYRQVGHQGQGHNQWVDNAWNQWGTNNHWDAQKSVDNKWGNNSGKINVTLNSVSGHYDHDFGQQQRGLGYEGHQNTSGDIGYTIGLGGHSFGYAPGSHSYGYANRADFGYGGWANNLGAWNHGANYDNDGAQFIDDKRDVTNDADDTADVKVTRRVAGGYGDLNELDDAPERRVQYAGGQVVDRYADAQLGTVTGLGRRNAGGATSNGIRSRRTFSGASYGGRDQGAAAYDPRDSSLDHGKSSHRPHKRVHKW